MARLIRVLFTFYKHQANDRIKHKVHNRQILGTPKSKRSDEDRWPQSHYPAPAREILIHTSPTLHLPRLSSTHVVVVVAAAAVAVVVVLLLDTIGSNPHEPPTTATGLFPLSLATSKAHTHLCQQQAQDEHQQRYQHHQPRSAYHTREHASRRPEHTSNSARSRNQSRRCCPHGIPCGCCRSSTPAAIVRTRRPWCFCGHGPRR